MPMKKKNPEPPKGTTLKASQAKYNEGRPGAYKRMNERMAYSYRNVSQDEANDDFPLNEKSKVSHILPHSLRDMERKSGKGYYYKKTQEEKNREIKEEDRLLKNNLEIKEMRTRKPAIANEAKKKSSGDRSSFSGQTLERAEMRKNIGSRKAQMNKPVVKSVSAPTRKPTKKK